MVKINESPRESFQVTKTFIPVKQKAEFINELLKVGFSIVDVGSFVSENIIPQMKDIGDVIDLIDMTSETEISILAGNAKYGKLAAEYEKIKYINYPLSISETLQKRNLNQNLTQSVKVIDDIIDLSIQKNKQPVISLAAGFGNPYDDDWGIDILMDWIDLLYEKGLRYIPLADTTGSGSSHLIGLVFTNVIREFSDVEFSLHLHTNESDAVDKISTAYESGCRNFDAVINGIGACTITGVEKVANLDTNVLVKWLNEQHIEHKIKSSFFKSADEKAALLFS